nr:metallophosphoesterase [Riemerella anatipestifer]
MFIISSIFMVFMLPKLLLLAFILFDDIIRVLQFGTKRILSKSAFYPERRNFITLIGLGAAALFSASVIDGIIFGKYRHTLRQVRLKLKNLPKEFKGYKIIQISDVHSGSFSQPEKLRKAIELINSQTPDLVLFTGDMVNNYAEEFLPFVDLFSQIKAKDGKYSVLGNHDYGDYGQWNSKEEKAQNIPKLIELQNKAGFKMLRNEHRIINKNGASLYLIGVENWGELPFPQLGDLDLATKGIPEEATKILMSHDPTHFDHIVKHHPKDIQLTLSGHTHGMQFGIDLKNIKWSPVKYRYPKWADLYESNGKYLYVNRGFGVLGFSGRVGINPEITVFTLE